MPQAEIQKLIQDEIQKASNFGRFSQQALPRHIHNGIDSPPAFDATRIFTGYMPEDGDATSGLTTNGFIYYPSGWTSAVSSDVYIITHNLGTTNYSIFATMGGPNTVAPCYVGTAISDNACLVAFVNTNLVTPALIPMDFWFTLVQVNNKDVNFPSYLSSKPSI